MTESEFNELADETLLSIEEAIDDSGADIDYDNAGGILTLEFENGSQIIINRQTPLSQIWVAAKSGGYHFNYDDQHGWQDERSGESFQDVLNRCLTEQSGEAIEIALD